jgi:hypothetical protein
LLAWTVSTGRRDKSGLAKFYVATILRPGHVCGVECHVCGVVARFSDFLRAGARQHTGAWAQERSLSPSILPSRRLRNAVDVY